MAAESEALKDQIQELTIDLEIIKNEISESGKRIKSVHISQCILVSRI